MLIKAPNFALQNGPSVSIRCPGCGNIGTFTSLPGIHDAYLHPNFFLGHRRCPNPKCQLLVFVVIGTQGQVIRTYPSQRIDFDPKGIPDRIVNTFSEALSCHAENLFIAAAIMIRRTLEELCENKKAEGKDLKSRINALQSKVVLPKELFDALDDLRLLGNDAAHIEAKTYDDVGREEIEVAIVLTKEVLKAVYQLDDLVARLRALKKA